MRLSLVNVATRLKPNTRWFQFSLRALFVVMTIFALWLGRTVSRVRNQIAVVTEVQQVGGSVWFENDQPKFKQFWQCSDRIPANAVEGPIWLRRLIGDDYFRNIVQIDFKDTPPNNFCEKDLERIAPRLGKLPMLETVRVESRRFSGTALASLAHSTSLKNLTVDGFPLTDEGMKHIGKLTNLETLNLTWTEVTDDGLAHITSLSNLRRLRLYSRNVTIRGIEIIISLPHLEELVLHDCEVTEDELATATQDRPKLKAGIY